MTVTAHRRGMSTSIASSSPRTAFVLSGGASLGALQVGMLHALYERGVVPDLLVGTSVGALNAAFIASRPQDIATAERLGAVWRELLREDIFPVSVRTLVGGLCGRRDHFVPNRGLRRIIGRYLEFDDLAASPVPLHLVAFDLAEGREQLLSDGPALDSVLAAASIPGVFAPVQIGDRRLVDGGVANNTPISHAVELGAERIYVLPTEDPANRQLRSSPKTALDVALHGLRLLVDSRLEADIVRYSSQVELIVLPAPNRGQVQPTSFEYARGLIVDARSAARAALARESADSHLGLVR